MSPDAMPWWSPVLALLLWLVVLAAHRRERNAALDHDGRGAVHRVLTKRGEDSALHHVVQREQGDSDDAERDEQGNDIHAGIVACQCLNRSELLSGFKCEHTR